MERWVGVWAEGGRGVCGTAFLCALLVMSSACFDSNTQADAGAADARALDAGRDTDLDASRDSGVPEEVTLAAREAGEAASAACRVCPECVGGTPDGPEFLACAYPIVEAAGQVERLLAWLEDYEEWMVELGRCYEELGCEIGHVRCSGVMFPTPPSSWTRANRMCRERS